MKYSDFGKVFFSGLGSYAVGKILEKNIDSIGESVAVEMLQGAGIGLMSASVLNMAIKPLLEDKFKK